jgi:hypothetical protein
LPLNNFFYLCIVVAFSIIIFYFHVVVFYFHPFLIFLPPKSRSKMMMLSTKNF